MVVRYNYILAQNNIIHVKYRLTNKIAEIKNIMSHFLQLICYIL